MANGAGIGNYYNILSPTAHIPKMKISEALALAQAADPSITSVSSTSHIASLWAGMGQIIRVQ